MITSAEGVLEVDAVGEEPNYAEVALKVHDGPDENDPGVVILLTDETGYRARITLMPEDAAHLGEQLQRWAEIGAKKAENR